MGANRGLSLLVMSSALGVVGVAPPAASASVFDRTTELVSAPTGVEDFDAGSADFRFASSDGSRVVFDADESLTADDGDGMRTDVFMRSVPDGTTTLVSKASGLPDPATAVAVFAGASEDGSRLFFATTQRMTADDNDSARSDLYERSGGVTRLVSAATGVADPDVGGVAFAGASADGTHVFFRTAQKLTPDDTDSNRVDLYERANGITTLVSAPTGTPDPDSADVSPTSFAVSADGSRVFFGTPEKLTANDTDTGGKEDIYERTGGTTTLVSQPAAGWPELNTGSTLGVDVSPSGRRVMFRTTERLVLADVDANRDDIYERANGETTWVSAPTGRSDPGGQSNIVQFPPTEDGSVIFLSPQPLVPEDTDAKVDVYRRDGMTTSLVSAATGGSDAGNTEGTVKAVSPDLSRIIFKSGDRLTDDDNDTNRYDVFERADGVTTLLSKPTEGEVDSGDVDLNSIAASRDARHVFFTTPEKLSPDDNDTNRIDVYERAGGVTTLVSRPAPGFADPDTADVLLGSAIVAYPGSVSDDGNRVFMTTLQKLSPDDADSNRYDVYLASDNTPPETVPPPQPDPSPGGPGATPGGPGPGGPGPGGGAPDRIKPVFSSFKLSPTRFAAASRGASAAAKKAKVGTKVTYRLSEAATVTFRVERATTGRRVGGKCVKGTKKNRRRKRCTRYVLQPGSFTHKGRAGSNSFKFTGRLRNRGLRTGGYALRATATDAAGNASPIARKRFTIVRR